MSVSVIKLIPTEPQFVPDVGAQEQARELVASLFPQAREVCMAVTDEVEFVHQGQNWERVLCPACGVEFDPHWGEAMDRAYEKRFADLSIVMPCCGAASSLNDLRYEFPAGFARFVLSIWDPNADLDAGQLRALEEILGCRLRKIWAHY